MTNVESFKEQAMLPIAHKSEYMVWAKKLYVAVTIGYKRILKAVLLESLNKIYFSCV